MVKFTNPAKAEPNNKPLTPHETRYWLIQIKAQKSKAVRMLKHLDECLVQLGEKPMENKGN